MNESLPNKVMPEEQGSFLEQHCNSLQIPEKYLNTTKIKKLQLLKNEAANPNICGDVFPCQPERVRTPPNQITAHPLPKSLVLVSVVIHVSVFTQALLSYMSNFFPSSYNISVENLPKHM